MEEKVFKCRKSTCQKIIINSLLKAELNSIILKGIIISRENPWLKAREVRKTTEIKFLNGKTTFYCLDIPC